MNSINLVILRNDLRLDDNPALQAVSGKTLVMFPKEARPQISSASRVWLAQSLASLQQQLNAKIQLNKQDIAQTLMQLCQLYTIDALAINQGLTPEHKAFDLLLIELSQQHGFELKFTRPNILWDLDCLQKADGTPYKVFSAFYRHAQKQAYLQPDSKELSIEFITPIDSNTIEAFIPEVSTTWAQNMLKQWHGPQPGELNAKARWQHMCRQSFEHYKQGRDIPSQPNTSLLSAAIEWGELSVRSMHQDLMALGSLEDVEHFKSELAWRTFSFYLLRDYPKMDRENINPKFNFFPWQNDSNLLQLWLQGKTGIPIVDAGMQELWHTGFMHNRVRMICASFLVKNLLIHWRHGLNWFEHTLMDASPANNSASWQWVAGSGMDAAPYFRIFNPVTQSQKFDKQGEYLCKWLPQLNKLPEKYRHCPWTAPAELLQQANFELGRDYPAPIIDLKTSRQSALDAFSNLKQLSMLE